MSKQMYSNVKVSMVLQLLVFLLAFFVSLYLLPDWYVCKWTAKNFYCFIWVIMIILCIRNKCDVGWFITISNVLGIVVGQVLGQEIKNLRIAKINEATSNERIYQLSKNYGVVIWLILIIIAFIIGEIFHRKRAKII